MSLQPPLEGLADYQLSTRTKIVHSLADFRRQWQAVAGSKSLVEVEASVGLLLFDIAERLELSPQERHAMLGGKLITQIDCVMEEQVSEKLIS